jgi:hypothetical protein
MELLEQFGIIPFGSASLYNLLEDYRSPKDKVRKLESNGCLIRLKKGLFVVSPEISKQELSTELIANHIYGPSYISFESALSLHNLIPEHVYTFKSATTKRKKEYQTPLGYFEYITVPERYFSVGLQTNVVKKSYAYILASPEKAICDLILSTSGLRLQSKKAIIEYLINDLRIDFESYTLWNPSIIEECIEYAYKKTELKLLLNFIRNEYSI